MDREIDKVPVIVVTTTKGKILNEPFRRSLTRSDTSAQTSVLAVFMSRKVRSIRSAVGQAVMRNMKSGSHGP